MKELATPPTPDFDSYIGRPDTTYIVHDAEEPIEALYEQGYLPYSGTKGLRNIFYSARSARIVLPTFTLSSENRRIAKKFDGTFSKKRIAASDFITDEPFYSFVLTYFAQRHGTGVMPRTRLELLFTSGLISTVVEYRQNGGIVGYVLEVESGTMRHFWYSAYELSLTKQSLGLWLMLDCIRDAASTGFLTYYLGTVYGAKALYKTNFEPLEWWSGAGWSRDVRELKEKARND